MTENGRPRANEEMFAPLPGKMRTYFLKQRLSRTISDYAVYTVFATLAFACAGVIDRKAPNCLGWFLYDFVDATIIFVTEWRPKSLKRGLYGDAVPEVVHARIFPRYVEKIRDGGMSREFAKVVRARHKADDTELKDISFLAKQRAFVRNMRNERTSDVPEGMVDKAEN